MRPRLSAGPVTLLLAIGVPCGIALSSCAARSTTGAAASDPAPARASAPSRFDFGKHSRTITTYSPAAQAAFDRGLTLAFAFNHGAAESQFRAALEADPSCAMAWWGIALVNGPHINNPSVPPEQAKLAWDAVTKAEALATKATPLERELIGALKHRYSADPNAERGPLDGAWAAAMRELWKAHPKDADIGTIFAESMMDLRPWDLWKQDGSPQPGTDEIVATLERVLQLDPNHPGANHFYIHVMEASPHPEKALPSADRLGALVPAAGHLVHMPGHIYIRTGRWADAAAANVKAIAADDAWRATSANPGFYNVYMAHNHQFLAFTQMMMGRRAEALKAARDMVAGIPPEFLKETAFIVDGALPLPTEVLIRFGQWEEILQEPEPAENLPISRAIRHFARAVALTALNRLDEADTERDAFRAAVKALPAEAIVLNNPASEVLGVASFSLDGEMLAKRGRLEEAITALREAARREDALKYDEPPDWIQPVRHTLGAVLLRAGHPEEAEAVYRQDLKRFPENGWSLFGLGRALRKQGKETEALEVEKRFRKAWETADTQIGATCLCQPAT